ncbi:hypothetical protein KP77_01650 [Jeotgalibacillus alimentarius]|uniref:Uncharacterized protein n=1 Tax=Jeotgalibacillus alimentarius TaxID=135826 RepID=A0A0C2RTV8_9BACL|nr:hypothetical protein [Jeotgalibacillus alimentarius]KIL53670.1 hypothetical protein KP77_01650 [Jeotgalibacillus alimentarius]
MKGTVRKIPAILMILFIVTQSFFYSYSLAVTPWNGNTWSGNTWSGNTWSGQTWEGSTWEGHKWKGSSFEETSWTSESWEFYFDLEGGYTSEPLQIDRDAWQGPPWKIPAWAISPAGSGDLISGTPGMPPAGSSTNPYIGGTMNGPVISQNPLLNPAPSAGGDPLFSNQGPYLQDSLFPYLPVNPGTITSATADSQGVDENDPPTLGYEANKYIFNGIIKGNVDLVSSVYLKGDNFRFSDTMNLRKAAVMGGLKLGFKDNGLVNFTDDALAVKGAIDQGKLAMKAYRSGDTLTEAAASLARTGQVFEQGSNVLQSATNLGAVTKLNAVSGGIGVVYGVADTVQKWQAYGDLSSTATSSDKIAAGAEVGSAVGETLMNAGFVAAAIPGGQTAAPILLGIGAGVFIASKTTKYIASNWKSITKTVGDLWDNPGKTSKELLSKAGSGIQNTFDSGVKTVAGWFGK